MKKYLMTLFLLLTGVLCGAVWAGEVLTDLSLQVDGKAVVIKNDVTRARENAVKNALEKAILQTAAKLLADKFEEEKFQAVKSILIGKADQYVKNYRITSEKSEQGEYIASVNVLVNQASVKSDLIQMDLIKHSGASVNVSVVLKDMKKHADFMRLKSFLQSRSQIVKSVYPCSLEWRQASCDLIITGDVQSLLSELERSGGYVVEERGKKQDGFELNLRMKEGVK